jgi:hypothetical protein
VELWTTVLTWLEQSALGLAIRGSGVWTYGIINLAHILGIATLFGSVLILDLRMLGWPRRVELASVAAIAAPLSVVGFTIAAMSGICMLATNGLDYATNPFLPIKFAAILLAVINAAIAVKTEAWKNMLAFVDVRQSSTLAIFGGISLLLWLCALSAGRLIGYW